MNRLCSTHCTSHLSGLGTLPHPCNRFELDQSHQNKELVRICDADLCGGGQKSRPFAIPCIRDYRQMIGVIEARRGNQFGSAALRQLIAEYLSDPGAALYERLKQLSTGNFITRIMQQIKRSRLPHKFAKELHCNDLMLLPWY
jgi:hypothetical protein